MSLAKKIINFYFEMDRNWELPKGFELIDPFSNNKTQEVFASFYEKYFSGEKPRRFILGINPGRHGAGVTGVPFTDPKIIEETCGIKNDFPKKNELSALFIYKMIAAYGGETTFYKDFYINSVCPLGFLKNGINCNYYDDKKLYSSVKSKIVQGIKDQIAFGLKVDKAYCLGNGKNFKFLSQLNNTHNFFEEVIPLPHPRWIMQYRRKKVDEFVNTYLEALTASR